MDSTSAQLFYFAHNTLQVPRVARQCMVALCEGAAKAGASTEIVSVTLKPDPSEPVHAPFSQLYGVEAPLRFECYKLPFGRVGQEPTSVAALRFLAYAWHLLRGRLYGTIRRDVPVVLSGRNASVLLLLIFYKRLLLRNAVVLADIHGMPHGRLSRWVSRNVDGNVCISAFLADELRTKLSLAPEKVRVAHTGVKPERFRIAESKEESAKKLGLSRERPLVVYSGKVNYRYEEVAYLLAMAKALSTDITLVIVGGRPDQIPPWEEECRRDGIHNVIFTGFKPPSEIPRYLNAADLLVMYYSPSPLNDYRSPGKLFEYLASGTPLIASRFKGVEEVVEDGYNGFLVDPYRPELLAQKVREVLGLTHLWTTIGENAVKTSHNYTWQARASVFLNYARDLFNQARGAASLNS